MENPSYYAIIPAFVRYADITPNAKLLYGEITALSNKNGFCWANNSHFGALYKVSQKQVSEWISQLVSAGFIESDYSQGLRKLSLSTPHEKVIPPPHEKVIHNNTRVNTTRSLYISQEIGEEEEQQEIGKINIDNIDEFRSHINVGSMQIKYPWRNIDTSIIECWLHYEDTGKVIRRSSASLVFSKWLSGGDPKRRQEEERAYRESISKRSKIDEQRRYEEEALLIAKRKKLTNFSDRIA